MDVNEAVEVIIMALLVQTATNTKLEGRLAVLEKRQNAILEVLENVVE